jgi:hypothetical protein
VTKIEKRLVAQLEHTGSGLRLSAAERLEEIGESSWEAIELMGGESPK